MAKATKKQAMGRGLSALLKDPKTDVSTAQDKNADKVIGNIAEIEITSIEVNPFQPRTYFNEEALKELSDSIKELGVIQPITVRKIGFNKYQLVSGERRFRASKLAGLTQVPAFIRIANDQEMLEMALVENIQRQDLDAIEVALSYQRLIEECELTQEKMSERVGKKRSTITNYLRLLKLDPIIQTGMRDGMLSMGHGRALINIEDTEVQLEFYELILKDGLSVRQVEELVKSYKNGELPVKNEKKEKSILAESYVNASKDLSEHFGNKVDIKVSKNGKGKLIINFHSEADFERIKKIIE
ncbi:MAG: ParB/RepB/Spo0J family partition protein [Bacteroidota bacterium]